MSTHAARRTRSQRTPSAQATAHRPEPRAPASTWAWLQAEAEVHCGEARTAALPQLRSERVGHVTFFQNPGRRHLAGASAANDFEAAVFPVFAGMSP